MTAVRRVRIALTISALTFSALAGLWCAGPTPTVGAARRSTGVASTFPITALDVGDASAGSGWGVHVNEAGLGYLQARNGASALVFDPAHGPRRLADIDAERFPGLPTMDVVGISEIGTIVGNQGSSDWTVAWVYDHVSGTRTPLGPGDLLTVVHQVSRAGTIAGHIDTVGPVVWTGPEHVRHDLATDDLDGFIVDLNDAGLVLGRLGYPVSDVPALWDLASGARTYLPVDLGEVIALNADGFVLGTKGVYDTTAHTFRAHPGWSASNEAGQLLRVRSGAGPVIEDVATGAVRFEPALPAGAVVVPFLGERDELAGHFPKADGQHAFTWDPLRGVTDLGTGGVGAGASQMTDSGWVVGSFDPSDDHVLDERHGQPWIARVDPLETANGPSAETPTLASTAPVAPEPSTAAAPVVAVPTFTG